MPTTRRRRPRAAIVTRQYSTASERTLLGNLISTDGTIIARHAVSFKGNHRVSSAGGRDSSLTGVSEHNRLH